MFIVCGLYTDHNKNLLFSFTVGQYIYVIAQSGVVILLTGFVRFSSGLDEVKIFARVSDEGVY
jgi:hypothetical protein